jgi:hypothetical protein
MEVYWAIFLKPVGNRKEKQYNSLSLRSLKGKDDLCCLPGSLMKKVKK